MVESNLTLLLNYPLITCEISNQKRTYTGVITIQHHDHKIHITERQKNNKLKFRLKAPQLEASNPKIEAASIVEYLDKLSVLLQQKSRTHPKNLVVGYKKLLHEYYEFVKFNLNVKSTRLAHDLTSISVSMNDDGGRLHTLQLEVALGQSVIFTPCGLDLPDKFCKDLEKSWGSLSEVYDGFLRVVEMLQGFFDVMEELDKSCCVMDPEAPTWRQCFRRIWLSENMSILVEVNPSNVQARPEIKFLGPEQQVLFFRQKLNEQLHQWDETTNLVVGLLEILEIERFPERPVHGVDFLLNAGECSICFSLRFNNKLPEVVCSNMSCENFYHVECLYQWLTSVNSKRIFKQIHGQCPNCEKGISCPLPDRDIN